mmetsp:Transcript_92281/g.238173  ORF Transcript_92281/g.238173 Transcript_92281/m.238173 type:complete len:210 (-) Transcript_92281:269-898(-)
MAQAQARSRAAPRSGMPWRTSCTRSSRGAWSCSGTALRTGTSAVPCSCSASPGVGRRSRRAISSRSEGHEPPWGWQIRHDSNPFRVSHPALWPHAPLLPPFLCMLPHSLQVRCCYSRVSCTPWLLHATKFNFSCFVTHHLVPLQGTLSSTLPSPCSMAVQVEQCLEPRTLQHNSQGPNRSVALDIATRQVRTGPFALYSHPILADRPGR